MEVSRAIDLIDDKMCWGRGKFSAHHMPEHDEYWQAGEMAIEALKKQEQNRWIPMVKRLPEVGQRVLVTFKDGAVSVLRCNDAGHLQCFYANTVAWKPAPEPFQEEEL